jgi:glucose/arabinose dehydrogenase
VDPTVVAKRPDLVAKAGHSRRVVAVALCGTGFDLLHGIAIPRRLSKQCIRRAARINQPIDASGYGVVRVPFRDGKASGPPEDFVDGFIARDDEEKQAWGRPVGLLQLPDGSILVSDDGGNRVWRVSCRK